MGATGRLVDRFGRAITYLRLSVTDRCNFRCVYCMGEDITFLPMRDLLTIEELDRLCAAFIGLGVRKLRLTGGEPLVRRGVETLIGHLGEHVAAGRLDELTLTTNGARLAAFAPGLVLAGVRRVNVSLDTLDGDRFRQLTRLGDLETVLAGIAAAKAQGLAVKINAVVFEGGPEGDIDALIAWCGAQGHDLTLIEAMPFGGMAGLGDGHRSFLEGLRRRLAERWSFEACDHATGGPARYVRVAQTGGRLGFIAPISGCFCDGCNRVRVTCTGALHPCLDGGATADLRAALRAGESNGPLERAIDEGLRAKPRGHGFNTLIEHGRVSLGRHMSVTGG
ncbi:GTP 3',8-cyclase MoaA [Rhodospirillum rubrum]|uniref:GTP 3',8-cyclase n=1 Tax=Rhodospirillum rubrum (strain ATCC 11170 / ATH 1.1.1 / DSM 467 / LMG 4362 / NCIMB 8255 / S1) TaxID=269796 RepID=Q2RXL5_RHORT|nr:GTP 3',8-cyclase MoaA [Rhodospirillum rubrum]ABC21130.1 Molybdenum cofactor biosynthesis protein [Rhodospirillum rubrum ATCC 11170]AEO46798.1 molybdenum cofactor biosynthesis protein [Rhodospirillum rubrum F11]MBK5952677.1 GTP 3',8-cyclase MoaA [Rhodospirillum rubrum]QXG80822.1 GTP 3',8-cyclase MoaA [Rhodospirillum rubrum]HAP98575.1 GTP 3',8-cyclase MoaA [Rhodospirillum rubrum]